MVDPVGVEPTTETNYARYKFANITLEPRLTPQPVSPEGSNGADEGTRTPMSLRTQRPQRCLYTNSSTSAKVACREGLEPSTRRFGICCSTIELPT